MLRRLTVARRTTEIIEQSTDRKDEEGGKIERRSHTSNDSLGYY